VFDGICDDIDDCTGAYDTCGICNGLGSIYECGCADIQDGDCDCLGNVFDACGVCGGSGPGENYDCDGNCTAELDCDGICGGFNMPTFNCENGNLVCHSAECSYDGCAQYDGNQAACENTPGCHWDDEFYECVYHGDDYDPCADCHEYCDMNCVGDYDCNMCHEDCNNWSCDGYDTAGVMLSLSAGWNWISINAVTDSIQLGSLLAPLGEGASYIASQSSGFSTNYDSTTGWWGSLTELDAREMYMLHMEWDAELYVMGMAVDVSTPISLVQGWNWIGYHPPQEVLVEDNPSNSNLEQG
jgi:hypothetical protein